MEGINVESIKNHPTKFLEEILDLVKLRIRKREEKI